MTFSTLASVKEELALNSSVTSNDSELNDLLTSIDNYINTRLQRFTSLPLLAELNVYLADLESRWVCARFRIRRATPQEQQQYQVVVNQIETQFQEFLKSNFQRSFFSQGSRTDGEYRWR
ncbi:MAG: hypothetical protein ACYC7D_05385 [Nitrososphaerales archaeon]